MTEIKLKKFLKKECVFTKLTGKMLCILVTMKAIDIIRGQHMMSRTQKYKRNKIYNKIFKKNLTKIKLCSFTK